MCILFYCGFNLDFSKEKLYWTSFLEYLFKVVHVFNGLFVLLLSCEFMSIRPLLDMCSEIFSLCLLLAFVLPLCY